MSIFETIPSVNDFGVDLELLTYNLTLSYEERISQHQSALNLMVEIEQAGMLREAKSQ